MGGSHLPDSRPTEINKIQILIFLGFLIVFLFLKKDLLKVEWCHCIKIFMKQ